MTKHYNKKSEQEKRRQLRKNMTYCEKLVWMYLRKKQFGIRFLRQYSVDKYVIDFYTPKLKLAVEIDGDVHNIPEQKEHDEKRQGKLEQFGITFVRITNEELLGNPNKAFEKIESVIKKIKESDK
jgi:very-short-patch-repair endonuclease